MVNLRYTILVWPVITGATIGLGFLTGLGFKALGIPLPPQEQLKIVLYYGQHCFDSLALFKTFAFLCAQVILLAPLLEETIFRLPTRLGWGKSGGGTLASAGRLWWILTTLFAALFAFAHYPDYQQCLARHALILKPLDNAFLALFFFGLAQAGLYRKTRALWCPMAQHALFNLTNLVLLFLFPEAAMS